MTRPDEDARLLGQPDAAADPLQQPHGERPARRELAKQARAVDVEHPAPPIVQLR